MYKGWKTLNWSSSHQVKDDNKERKKIVTKAFPKGYSLKYSG